MRSKKGARWPFHDSGYDGVQELLAFPESFSRLEPAFESRQSAAVESSRCQVEEAARAFAAGGAPAGTSSLTAGVGELRVRIEMQSLTEETLDPWRFVCCFGPDRARLCLN